MLSERLKKETQQAHLEVEKIVIKKIKTLNSRKSYIHLLQVFYGYFSPVEKKIETFICKDLLPDIEERRKSESILKDIAFFSPDDAGYPSLCSALPDISGKTQALGAMYVLEGSTLGGIHLAKMISVKMNIAEDEGIGFFSGYKEDTLPRWSVFKTLLDSYGTNEIMEIETVTAANETFTKFKQWLELNQEE